MLLQLVRANHPSLTDKLLKSNLRSWNEWVETNPLAEAKLSRNIQQSLHIVDGLPWMYQFASNGDPICLNASELLSLADRLDALLFQSRSPTQEAIDALATVSQDVAEASALQHRSTTTAVLERTGSISLKLRDLMTNLQGEEFSPLEPFLQIQHKHVSEMGIILELIWTSATGVKSRLDKIQAGETTDVKRNQVHLLTEIDTLIYSSEIQTFQTIYQILNSKGTLGTHFKQLPLLGKPLGGYFFLDVDLEF